MSKATATLEQTVCLFDSRRLANRSLTAIGAEDYTLYSVQHARTDDDYRADDDLRENLSGLSGTRELR